MSKNHPGDDDFMSTFEVFNPSWKTQKKKSFEDFQMTTVLSHFFLVKIKQICWWHFWLKSQVFHCLAVASSWQRNSLHLSMEVLINPTAEEHFFWNKKISKASFVTSKFILFTFFLFLKFPIVNIFHAFFLFFCVKIETIFCCKNFITKKIWNFPREN